MKPAKTLAEELLEGPLAYYDFIGSLEVLSKVIEEDRKAILEEAATTIEDQIRFLEQGRAKAVRAHKALLADFDDHIGNLKRDLPKLNERD